MRNARQKGLAHAGARRLVAHAVDDRLQESVREHRVCEVLRDAPSAQVEELVFVERADGRAVAANHVVRVDLEVRLGVDVAVSESSRLRFS